MIQKPSSPNSPSEKVIKDIRRATRKHYSAEDKIRIVLDGLRGEGSIPEFCHREGIAESLCNSWSKEFLEAWKPSPGRWCVRLRLSKRISVSQRFGCAFL